MAADAYGEKMDETEGVVIGRDAEPCDNCLWPRSCQSEGCWRAHRSSGWEKGREGREESQRAMRRERRFYWGVALAVGIVAYVAADLPALWATLIFIGLACAWRVLELLAFIASSLLIWLPYECVVRSVQLVENRRGVAASRDATLAGGADWQPHDDRRRDAEELRDRRKAEELCEREMSMRQLTATGPLADFVLLDCDLRESPAVAVGPIAELLVRAYPEPFIDLVRPVGWKHLEKTEDDLAALQGRWPLLRDDLLVYATGHPNPELGGAASRVALRVGHSLEKTAWGCRMMRDPEMRAGFEVEEIRKSALAEWESASDEVANLLRLMSEETHRRFATRPRAYAESG